MTKVEDAELGLLFALYIEFHRYPTTYVDLEVLYRDYHLKFPHEWLESCVTELEDRDWIHVSRTHSGTSAILDRTRLTTALKILLDWLGGTSLTVDVKKERILSDADASEAVPFPNGWDWMTYYPEARASSKYSPAQIPASDRLVSLSDNDPLTIAARKAVDNLAVQLRLANDLRGFTDAEIEEARREVYFLEVALKGEGVRVDLIEAVAKTALVWISKKAAEQVVGTLALAALAAISALAGFTY